jgi:hypothetical protein
MGKDKNNKKNVTFKNDTRSGTKSKPRRDNLRVLASHKLARVDSHSAGDEEAWGTSNMDDAKETEDLGACRGKCDKGQCTSN